MKNLPKIADNVEVGYDSENFLHFIFVNSRRHLTVKAEPQTIEVVNFFDGNRTIAEISKDTGISEPTVNALVEKMIKLRLVRNVATHPTDRTANQHFYARQLEFFSDFTDNPEAAQERLKAATVAIVGLGAIGGGIAAQLARAGVGCIRALDMDNVSASNLSRHQLFQREDIGISKIVAAKLRLSQLNPDLKFEGQHFCLEAQSDIKSFFNGCDIVINCADQPSVAETSEWVGRACMQLKIPHILAGGYRTHLGFVGPTVLPFQSACWMCFAVDYRKNDPFAAKGWKPLAISRPSGGSLGPLSSVVVGFHAWEAIRILTCILPPQMVNAKVEINFADFTISKYEVIRNPDCSECGNLRLQSLT